MLECSHTQNQGSGTPSSDPRPRSASAITITSTTFNSLCLTFASSPTGLAYNSSGRALWVGFLACESARIRAWPQDPPTPISLYLRLPTQLHGRATSRDLPPTSVSSSSFHYSHTHSALSLRPAPDHCNPPSHSPQLSYNGSAQLILPARAVLCPHAGPLIDHQRASTLEHPTLRPSPTVSDDSSSYNDNPLCCNAGLIREELKASATFPHGRKVLTCASTSPTTPRLRVRCLAKRRGSAITGLRSL